MPAAPPPDSPSGGCLAVEARAVAVDVQPLPPDQVVAGTPCAGAVDVHAGAGLVVGVWEHTAGVSTDVEADEVFVVVAGRATVEVDAGPVLELVPGTVGVLRAGSRTRWTVHEPLRKVFVVSSRAGEDG